MDSRLYKSFSLSNGNENGGGGPKFGPEASKDGAEEGVMKGHSRPLRRPVRAVRPLSALSASGSFLQINHLQGELVRKRKVSSQRCVCYTRLESHPIINSID